MCGGGVPCAAQSILPPVLLENSKWKGGSMRNTGPCKSRTTLRTETNKSQFITKQ